MSNRICSVEGCGNRTEVDDLCLNHFLNPVNNVRGAKGRCSTPKCTGRPTSRGMCSMHYSRWRRHGDPSVVKDPPSPAQDWVEAHLADPPDTDECIEWPFYTQRYPRLTVTGNEKVLVTHLVLEADGRPRPASHYFALHSCHNSACLNQRHLRWGTAEENSQDAVEAGRTARGERMHTAKLTADDVREIRRLCEDKRLAKTQIAQKFGVTPATIRRVETRQTWSHVQ